METKSIWDKVALIDLPIFPFQADNKTEETTINYLIKAINKVTQLDKYELEVDNLTARDCFEKSRQIIAFDMSVFDDEHVTELNTLQHIIFYRPFILVNNFMKKEKLIQTELSNLLLNNGHILPTFESIIPYDNYHNKYNYGNKFIELVSGRINKLDIKEVPICASENILRSRFPNLKIESNYLKIEFPITWLGVNDPAMVNLLNHLFNNNVKTFDTEKIKNKYGVKKKVLNKYINNSMLFYKINKNRVGFRFRREYIVTQLMYKLMKQFNNSIIENNVISSNPSHKPNKKIKTFEYHTISNIFENITYAIKLLSYLKKNIGNIEYDQIILAFDDFKNPTIEKLLFNIFGKPIIRVINLFNNPTIYPFSNSMNGNRIIILTDVINSGKYILKVKQLFENTFKCEIALIYTLIINVELSSITEELLKTEVRYFAEKKLSDVQGIKKLIDENVFKESSIYTSMFFWQLANSLLNVECGCFEHQYLVSERSIQLTANYSSKFNMNNLQIGNHFSVSHFSQYIKQIVNKEKIEIILIKSNIDQFGFQKIVNQLFHKIKIIYYKRVGNQFLFEEKDKEHLRNKNIMLFMNSLLLGERLLNIIDIITEYSNNITILSLHSKKNINKSTFLHSKEYLNTITEKSKFYNYYNSDIPYYLYEGKSFKNRYVKYQLNEINENT